MLEKVREFFAKDRFATDSGAVIEEVTPPAKLISFYSLR